jgi:hypothetical protein
MRKSLWFLVACALWAREHTVMVEPLQIYHIKAAVAGQVVQSKDELEGKEVKNALVVRLDDEIDKKELRALQKKLKLLENAITIERSKLKTLQSLAQIKRSNYERIKDLKTKSRFEKDQRKSDYLNAQSLVESQRAKIANLSMQKKDLELAIEKLKDKIAKKNVRLSGYIYKVYPKNGDFVALGAPLVDLADTSKGKVVLYLSKEEIGKNKIFIDGKETNLTFSKLLTIPDDRHLGEYRAEILVPKPKIFGKFIKVEIK